MNMDSCEFLRDRLGIPEEPFWNLGFVDVPKTLPIHKSRQRDSSMCVYVCANDISTVSKKLSCGKQLHKASPPQQG